VWPVLLDPKRRPVVVARLRTWVSEEAQALWTSLQDAPVPVDVAERAATWLALQQGNSQGRDVHAAGGRWKTAGYAHLSDLAREKGFTARLRVDCLADKVDALPWLPATMLHQDVATVPADLVGPDDVVLLDPDYQGTSGYSQTLPRAFVLDVAQRFAATGALVMVCEAEPLAALDGWHAVDLTAFGRSQPEWVTMSRKPAWTPDVQVDLFARTT